MIRLKKWGAALFIVSFCCIFFLSGKMQAKAEAETQDVNVSHFAFRRKNRGPSAEFKGDVEVIVVRVSTPKHPWTEKQENNLSKVCQSSVDIMNSEARRYGVKLNLSCAYLDVKIPMEFQADDKSGWYSYILKDVFQCDSMKTLQKKWETQRKKNDTPVMFMFNSWDRSATAFAPKNIPSWNEEYSYIFCDTQMHDNYLTHELLHQYGAIDFYDYNNEGVEAIAKEYFPHSNMLCVSHEIDELTAYLIGWLDELSPKARMFLKETEGKRC